MSLARLFFLKELWRTQMRQWRHACLRRRLGKHASRFTVESLEPRVLLSATPAEGLAPEIAEGTATEPALAGPSLNLPNLDVNLDGQATPEDAMVILRYLSLVNGPALTAGLVTGGERTDPDAIKAYLDRQGLALLDVNLDQAATPEDAIVILRYLSLVSGPALTAGVVTGGDRTDPMLIAQALDNANPAQERVPPVVIAALQQDTGLSPSDGITSNPAMTGTIADINDIVSFTAGLDTTLENGFVDVLNDLQPSGSFTFSAARLSQIAGGTLPDGSHTLHLRVTDARGNAASLDQGFVLDTTPPDIQVVQPVHGAIVDKTAIIEAHAEDNVAVTSVQLLIDGQPVGPLMTHAPYAVSWDASGLPEGIRKVEFQASDPSGNVSMSPSITIAVSHSNVFRNEILATGFDLPTAIRFLPDGRLLVVELQGTIRVISAPYAEPDSTPFLQLENVGFAGVQQGIYDIALDPNFAENHYYYIFYTASQPNRDRLSRFTANDSLTGTFQNSEVILYEDTIDANAEHHGGSVTFGNDGMIYFTTGEHFDASAAQSLTSPRGKLHRIKPDGTVPTDNPFYDGDGPNWDSIWALGLRNPYRSYFDIPTNRLYIGDVGGNDYQTAMEEINVGARGVNYGWPDVEGVAMDPRYTNPLYAYAHDGRDAAITGGFVYHGLQFPVDYQGSYFFADYTQNWIRRLTFDESGNVTGVLNFEPADGVPDGPYGDIVYLTEGPDGSLYYLDLGYSDTGGEFGVSKLRRISYISSDLPPVVAVAADPLDGLVPLTVSFTSQGTFDPEGAPLTFLWTFGDGETSTLPDPVHTYVTRGLYHARLSVSDGVNVTSSGSLAIAVGNHPVVNLVTSPSNNGLFRAGDLISYSATATDVEDGNLPAGAFAWNIDFLHEGHVHPGTAITGVTGGTFSIPTTGHDFSGFTRYRITLTVTDSDGLQATASSFVFPDKVNLTFDTAPAALTLYLDGIAHTAPFIYDTLIGFQHTIEARDQSASGVSYTFVAWSDEGSQIHQIIVPDVPASYEATFQESIPSSISAALDENPTRTADQDIVTASPTLIERLLSNEAMQTSFVFVQPTWVNSFVTDYPLSLENDDDMIVLV